MTSFNVTIVLKKITAGIVPADALKIRLFPDLNRMFTGDHHQRTGVMHLISAELLRCAL
jgi:hypothetical protein